MSTPPESLSLQVTIHLNPEDLPTFWTAFQPAYEAVIAEPECTFFELYQAPDSPGTVSWVENWSASKEWLIGVQMAKPYYRDYLAVTEPLFVKPREVKLLTRVGAPFTMVKKANGGLLD
ncbi:putative quinol monooxygenase [Aspergillus saccharolyticus JOP 1030-1]|uniref:ABM domain-containing protein n=1 Tax=Aspergillus saccharolyticus JOP 1030-1 TaxID=1450539 RepID=A0A318Z948_9EURO|nr:hypothetical protein BP01DRAFT_343658 [Aspergillus saccharolyticus JOP 1030-1]PYH43911.1 hypothetical protein BP01DRAFT_343658 [Aspergillus saccharolyticus JOP 1030-1]